MHRPNDLQLTAAQRASLWQSGNLFYLLHAGQLDAYRRIKQWQHTGLEQRKAGIVQPGLFPRVFVLDCARRFGKDVASLVLALEQAYRIPGSVLTYATAFQKDINEIVMPLMEMLLEDCPESIRPVYRTVYEGTSNGWYFHNKSVLKLVGVETRPASLRGRFSDGFFFSEGAYIGKLEEALVRVVMPQLQGRLHATIIMNSTPPEAPGHFWDTHICPDAMERGAYVLKTIDDNPMLTPSERDEFIRAAGGPDSETALREYYCIRVRSAVSTVVPEFSRESNVRDSAEPAFAHGYTVIDPGVRDICAVSCGYYDFERAKLVIRRSWGKRNANTNEVVAAIRDLEERTFANLRYWNNKGFQSNPFHRYSDTEARLILDLNKLYGMRVLPISKDQGKEAMLHSFRSAVQTGQVEWHSDAEESIAAVEAAVWNKDRTDWARSPVFGHYDQLAVAQYMWRMCNRVDNPLPPQGVTMQQKYSADRLVVRRHTLERHTKVQEQWRKLWSGRKFVTAGRH